MVVVHKLDRFARNRRLAFDAFHRLGTAGVGFVSIAENMDYSTPAGQFMLTMLVGMAQFYSDNLSFETKKGKHERKAQGLHNGLLPFGVTAEPSGLPVLDRVARACDVATRREVVPGDGLVSAFELAAAGKTDREIARALTAAGYRTSGNRGANPFTKDTVRVILRNRFYVGELPDGNGGWVPGKHGALIDPALFERAQRARDINRKRPRRAGGRRSPWGCPAWQHARSVARASSFTAVLMAAAGLAAPAERKAMGATNLPIRGRGRGSSSPVPGWVCGARGGTGAIRYRLAPPP